MLDRAVSAASASVDGSHDAGGAAETGLAAKRAIVTSPARTIGHLHRMSSAENVPRRGCARVCNFERKYARSASPGEDAHGSDMRRIRLALGILLAVVV